MKVEQWIDRLSGLALAISGSTLLVNLLCFRRPRGILPADAPMVSILVPARNEAHNIEACVRSLLAQDYPWFELIVLDDHSEDGTAEILHQLSGRDSRLTAVPGNNLPLGWGGKNWACHQLAEAADPGSRYLLFTDADTIHAPDTVRRAIAEAERGRLALLSLMPEQRVKTWAERLVVPLLPLQILGYLPFPAMEWTPVSFFAAANGQFMLFRREAYERFGGHSALPLGLAEDVILSHKVKAYGGRVRLANGAGLVQCRMYRSTGEVIAGFRRSFAGGFRFGAWISSGMLLFNVVAYLLPFLRAPFSSSARVQAALILLLRMTLAWRTRTPRRGAVAHPAGMVLLLWAQTLALYDAFVGGETVWKGRRYQHRGESSAQVGGDPTRVRRDAWSIEHGE